MTPQIPSNDTETDEQRRRLLGLLHSELRPAVAEDDE